MIRMNAVSLLMAAGLVCAATNATASDRFILLAAPGAAAADVEAAIEEAGGRLARSLPAVGVFIVTSSAENFAESVAAARAIQTAGPGAAQSLPETEAFPVGELDGPTGLDLFYNLGWTWGVNRVRAPEAWEAGITGSHDTVLAVIDTGIATNHPDLGPNMVHSACYTSAGSDADGSCNPYPGLSDHGTHVAGTAAAAFDGGMALGVAPNIGLANYNVFEYIPGCGTCAYGDARWAAMIDAADRGFDVITMSLGSTAASGGRGTNELAAYVAADRRVVNYVLRSGTTIVASAGNSGLDLTGEIIHLPGDQPGVINVAATGIQPAPFYPYPDSYDIRPFYSNIGAPVTVTAPGGDCGEIEGCSGLPGWQYHLILSTIAYVDPVCAATESCRPWYGFKGGTSMATPHVAATAALVKDVYPELNARQVANVVKRTAENLGDRHLFGHGMVDAAAAVGL
jgi:subtilisin family serine protease